jgi:hypothetical protein
MDVVESVPAAAVDAVRDGVWICQNKHATPCGSRIAGETSSAAARVPPSYTGATERQEG